MRSLLLLLFLPFTLSALAQRSDFNAINFAQAEHIANRLKGEELTNLPVLTHKLTDQLHTDVERFRAIYYWVCHNIRGDYDLMSKNDRKRRKLKNDTLGLAQWNHQFKKEVFTRLRNDKETLCTGYAYLIKALSHLAGLECEIINGYGVANDVKSKSTYGPNHSWNAIKLNGKWYVCDATWSSGYTDMSTFLFEFDFDNSYFLMSPAVFAKSHTPSDKKWALLQRDSLTINTKGDH